MRIDKFDILFDHVFEIFDLAESPCDMPDSSRSSLDGKYEFCGTRNFAEAMKLARFGWPKGLADMEQSNIELTETIGDPPPKKRINYAPAGHAPHIGRYLEGNPDNMMHRRLRQEKRIITIGVNISISGRVDKSIIMRRGAGIMMLIDALERRGYSVGVTLYEMIRGYIGGKSRIRCPIKAPNMILEKDRLAFMLGHPSMLRRILFAVEEHQSEKYRKNFGIRSSGGYGTPMDIVTDDNIYIPAMIGGTGTWGSPESAMQYIKETLEKQGVKQLNLTKGKP